MKNRIMITIVLFASLNVFAQRQSRPFADYEQVYNNLDITSLSGYALRMINQEMKSLDSTRYTAFIASKRAEVYQKLDLGKKSNQQLFLDSYNNDLQKVKNGILKNDILLQVSPRLIADYGNDLLSRYSGNFSSDDISKLIEPVIKSKLAEYANDKIGQISLAVLNENDRFNQLAEQLVAYWKARGEQVNTFQDNTVTLVQKIDSSINQIAVPDSLKDYIIQSAGNLAENLKAKFSSGWTGTITIIDSQSNIYRNALLNDYNAYATTVANKADAEFKKLGAEINTLSSNERTVQNTLLRIQHDFDSVQQQIQQLAPQNALQMTRMIQENFIRSDVINKYVNKGLEVYTTISTVSDIYASVSDPDFIASLSLDNLNLPTLSEAFSSAAGIASSLGNVFPNARFPEVANIANKLMSAVNIGTGIGELFSYNPMGLINIFSGLSGLFGGKPEPSPEMKMMQHMMDYMQDQFSNIDTNLHIIERQLDNLTTTVQHMYSDMMKSFSVIGDDLNRIQRQDDALLNRTSLLLRSSWNLCPDVRNGIQEIKDYRDYDDFLQNCHECSDCFSAITRYTIKQNGDFNTELNSSNFNLADLIVNGVFNPTTALFKLYNANQLGDAVNALNIVPKNIDANGNIYFNVTQKDRVSTILNKDSVFATYYDYEMLGAQINYLDAFSYMYQIADINFHVPAFYTYLTERPAVKKLRNAFVTERFRDLLDLINYSITQQSLMAGNTMMNYTYNYLLGACDCNTLKDSQILRTIVTVLDSNILFAKNFASMLINKSINRTITNDKARAARFTELYFASDISRLNNEFSLPMVSYANTGHQIVLEIKGRGSRNISIPVPPPSFIISGEMAQSPGLYILLAAKQKAVDDLIDLTYFQNFTPAAGLQAKDYLYLIQDLK